VCRWKGGELMSVLVEGRGIDVWCWWKGGELMSGAGGREGN